LNTSLSQFLDSEKNENLSDEKYGRAIWMTSTTFRYSGESLFILSLNKSQSDFNSLWLLRWNTNRNSTLAITELNNSSVELIFAKA
jgi:hypothetical protein